MTVLGEYLKEIRQQQELSLRDVYRRTGVSDSKLSRIENGTKASNSEPSILKALSKLYTIDLIELYCMAGYLDEEILSSYKQVFKNVNLLTEDEKDFTQKLIDLFTKGRE